jgi:hypothetical protein
MTVVDGETANAARVSRFSIADMLVATSLAAGPLAFVSVIGWKSAVCLTLMAVVLTIGRACKRGVFQFLLFGIAVATGAAIAATAETMPGLWASLGWMLVVVFAPIIWQSRNA